MKNNFIVLNDTFYNTDLIVSIIPGSTQLEDWSSGKCVYVGKYRPKAYINYGNNEVREKTLERQEFLTAEEAEIRAKEIIQTALNG